MTDHDVPLFGDFTYYVSAVANSPLDDGGDQTSVTLTPGIRTHLGRDWYFLAGMPTPVDRATRRRPRHDLLVHEGVVGSVFQPVVAACLAACWAAVSIQTADITGALAAGVATAPKEKILFSERNNTCLSRI